MWMAAAMGVGTAMQIYGNITGNMDQAAAEERNEAFYLRQAQHARFAMAREEDIFRQESDTHIGDQVTTFAKSGVDLSGSALSVLSNMRGNQMDEVTSIRREGQMRIDTALARAADSKRTAETLRSFKYNLLQAGSTFLTGGARAGSMMAGNAASEGEE